MDAQPVPVPNDEPTIWEGHPSHVVNLPIYLLCGLIAGALLGGAILFHGGTVQPAISYGLAGAALLPLLYALSKFIQNQSRRYQITTERIHFRHGVILRKTDELELYRVKDYVLVEPFFLRLFGLGNIILSTADVSNTNLVLRAVPQITTLRDQIRKNVELCRTRKGVRIAELE